MPMLWLLVFVFLFEGVHADPVPSDDEIGICAFKAALVGRLGHPFQNGSCTVDGFDATTSNGGLCTWLGVSWHVRGSGWY